jgi:ABC-2 type transport system ATP-binding protein
MSDEVALRIENVSKQFILPHQRAGSVKSIITNPFKKFDNEKQQALNNISFEVRKGEFFGIVGRNGSGKSTLLKCIAGVYSPDTGGITINGSLVPFIELGVGFNPELSGRDNVYLNGALLGFNRSEMYEMYEEIVEFAELEQFMDQKLKNYSSGMQVRLAFSIAIQAKGDILILDEVLAVGDSAFQKKCYNYFMTLKNENKTVVLVTHNMGAVEKFCERMLVLDKGKVDLIGSPKDGARRYEQMNAKTDPKKDKQELTADRWGSGKVMIDNIVFKQGKLTNKKKKTMELEQGKELEIEFTFKTEEKSPEHIVVGLAFNDAFGINIAGPNSMYHKVKSNEKLIYKIDKIPLNPGDYTVNVVVFDKDVIDEYDHIEAAINLNVVSDDHQQHGKINLFGTWRQK